MPIWMPEAMRISKPSLRSALNLEETVDFIYERTEFLDEAMAQYTPPERYWNYWMEGLES